MATSRMGAHPSPNCRCKSELNGVKVNRVKGGFNGSNSLPSKSSDLQHWIFKASSFSPSPLLPSTKLWESVDSILTVDCDCRSCNQPKRGAMKIADNGLFGVFGYQRHLRSQSSQLVSTSFPMVRCFGFGMPEPLFVPTLSHFEVKSNCCPTGFHGSVTNSQNCGQVGKHHTCDGGGFPTTNSSSNVIANGMDSGGPCLTSPSPAQEASGCSENSGDIISGSHKTDEIACGCDSIHALGNGIHASSGSDAGSEYYSDSERCDHEAGRSVDAPSGVAFNLSAPNEPENHLQLKKLLSDESGYCESSSSDACISPCDWSSKDVFLDSYDIEEWEDDSTGGLMHGVN